MRAASSPVRATSFSVRRRAARGFGRVAHFAHIKPWHVSVTGKERLPACSERCKGSPSLHADGTETAFWTRPEDLSFLGDLPPVMRCISGDVALISYHCIHTSGADGDDGDTLPA